MTPRDTAVLTVHELTLAIKETLNARLSQVRVWGEVTNLRAPTSGHLYFSLKDDQAQVGCVLWRSVAQRMRSALDAGMVVVASGNIDVYAPQGRYQLVVTSLEPHGLGALQALLEQLKARLRSEGLFDPARKRPLPWLPRRIGIVTSPTGAAIQDMVRTIFGRFPRASLLLDPVRVQGNGAADEIAAAIRRFDRRGDVDVLIVGRGGGSLEDLWAFNEEVVARAIAECHVPVVSAVGHEIDYTVADMVADVRALTPTDAGVRVVPEEARILETLDSGRRRLHEALRRAARGARSRLHLLGRSRGLSDPRWRCREAAQRVDEMAERLHPAVRGALRRATERLAGTVERLDGLSPLRTLARGYSVTYLQGTARPLRRAMDAGPGVRLWTRLVEGRLVSRVEEVHPHVP